MKSSKAQIFFRVHKMPELHFEDQRLTSFAGLVIIQELFSKLEMKARLRACFDHMPVSPIFGHHIIVLTLIVHLMLGVHRSQYPPKDAFAAGKPNHLARRDSYHVHECQFHHQT